MKSSKLIQIIETLSDKEFKIFIKKAFQRFHDNNKMTLFIDFIERNAPKLEAEDILKEKVFYYIFPNEKFADIRVRELMSALNKFVKEYLIHTHVESNEFTSELYLLKQYNHRNLETLYNSQLKVVKKLIEKDKYINKEYYRRTFLLSDVENEHFTKSHLRVLDENIQKKLDNFDFYYFSLKLTDSCEMLNRERLLNQKYDLHIFEEIEVLIEKYRNTYLNQPSIHCYYEIYKLMQTQDDLKQFNNTIQVLKKNTKHFTNKELKALFDFPKNYCIQNINKGIEKYIPILFDLEQYIIDKEFNLVNGFISHVSYNNIITIAIKLKKYAWSEQFIEDYKEKVDIPNQENAYTMNKANLFFAKEKYDDALVLLNQVEFSDVYYAISAKIIIVKSYYSLKEFETLNYFITAFKLYIKRNKEANITYKNGSGAFLSYFKKILLIAEKGSFYEKSKKAKKLETLQAEILSINNIFSRSWLLKIIEELK